VFFRTYANSATLSIGQPGARSVGPRSRIPHAPLKCSAAARVKSSQLLRTADRPGDGTPADESTAVIRSRKAERHVEARRTIRVDDPVDFASSRIPRPAAPRRLQGARMRTVERMVAAMEGSSIGSGRRNSPVRSSRTRTRVRASGVADRSRPRTPERSGPSGAPRRASDGSWGGGRYQTGVDSQTAERSGAGSHSPSRPIGRQPNRNQRRPPPPATLLSEGPRRRLLLGRQGRRRYRASGTATITVWNENGPGTSRARTLENLVIHGPEVRPGRPAESGRACRAPLDVRTPSHG